MKPVGNLARVLHTRTWPEALEGVIEAWGPVLFIIAPPFLYLARWEGRQRLLQSVTKGRCSPHPPRGPLFVLLDLYALPQVVGFRVWRRIGTIGCF